MSGAWTIALASLGVLVLMSLRANRAFRNRERLPMQFGVTGDVGWSAPRVVALSFMPGLTALTYGFLAQVDPHMHVSTALICAVSFIAGHALHFWLISRT